MPRGGILTVSVKEENDGIVFLVKDTGTGITKENMEKIFTPFFTTKATGKKGTGLGLYVIQKIVNFHEGTISIDSTYCSGTKFEIVLPVSTNN